MSEIFRRFSPLKRFDYTNNYISKGRKHSHRPTDLPKKVEEENVATIEVKEEKLQSLQTSP
jgi:hypothetical protein